MPRPASKDHYTFADCLIWGKDERIEIINGEAVMMAPPTRIHQEILMELSRQLARACLKRTGMPRKIWTRWLSRISPWFATTASRTSTAARGRRTW